MIRHSISPKTTKTGLSPPRQVTEYRAPKAESQATDQARLLQYKRIKSPKRQYCVAQGALREQAFGILRRRFEQKSPSPNTRKLFGRSASVLGRPRRSEPPSCHTRELFCRSAAVLGRPRRSEPPSPNTRTLFCRSASVLGRRTHVSACQLKRHSFICQGTLRRGVRGRTRSDGRAFVC